MELPANGKALVEGEMEYRNLDDSQSQAVDEIVAVLLEKLEKAMKIPFLGPRITEALLSVTRRLREAGLGLGEIGIIAERVWYALQQSLDESNRS